jgi:hypothetical protein
MDRLAEADAIPFELAAVGRFDADSGVRKQAEAAYRAHMGLKP